MPPPSAHLRRGSRDIFPPWCWGALEASRGPGPVGGAYGAGTPWSQRRGVGGGGRLRTTGLAWGAGRWGQLCGRALPHRCPTASACTAAPRVGAGVAPGGAGAPVLPVVPRRGSASSRGRAWCPAVPAVALHVGGTPEMEPARVALVLHYPPRPPIMTPGARSDRDGTARRCRDGVTESSPEPHRSGPPCPARPGRCCPRRGDRGAPGTERPKPPGGCGAPRGIGTPNARTRRCRTGWPRAAGSSAAAPGAGREGGGTDPTLPGASGARERAGWAGARGAPSSQLPGTRRVPARWSPGARREAAEPHRKLSRSGRRGAMGRGPR